ncbi:MAG TPA: tyrosine-type recombinase/integrase [Candidatus Acidoferrum sp.]|nr:tyrosine-type recombinase/integrase [Candidatus Acidoferrum sp.]
MYLTVDGQKKFKSTGVSDLEEAMDKLREWEAQEKVGHRATNGLRYEELRDDYLASGKNIGQVGKGGAVSSIQRDLDAFFKNIRVSAIGGRLTEFRKWRESQAWVLESKAETLQKEIALRTMKVMGNRRKPLSDVEKAKIEKEATAWVENGVKATTDKRLKYLSAIFHHAFKKTQKISKADIPYFPILGTKVDNVKQGKFTDQDLKNLLDELPAYNQLIRFLNLTGMRSGQAAAMTWDMIDKDNVLRMPGFLTKNREAYSLALADENGKPYAETAFMVNMKNRPHGAPVFDITNFRQEWRTACAKLKLGWFNPKTRNYRGAQPHDFRRTAITNFAEKGVNEDAAMSVTGHKTTSAHKRYKIGGAQVQRTALGAVSKAR